MRTRRQSDFWFVLVVLLFGQFHCFGQALTSPDSKRERIDRYDRLINEERWTDALEILQTLDPSDIPGFITNQVRLKIMTGDFEEANRLLESSEEAIDDAWSLSCLGWWYIDKSPDKSRSYITKSLDLDPSLQAIRNALFIANQQNDLRFAAESLRKLYKRYPCYMGGYAVDLGFPLDEADRKFGRDQVARACEDRPQLARLITGSPRIQEWLIRRFGGMFIGRHAAWSNSRPEELKFEHSACHTPASPFADAVIWVSSELDGDHQLVSLVYELLNAESSDEQNKLSAKVRSSLIDKVGYLREVAKLEHGASLKEKAFFVVEYFAGGLPDTISLENCRLVYPIEFEEFFKAQPKLITDYYAEAYDSLRQKDKGVEDGQ